MTITLLAVSLNDSPLTQPITACFDARGGTIGRADHNTMALPDPERHISRLQAEVTTSGSGYLIKNVGAANPITVAGRQLLAGESSPLGPHDEVRIGGYLLRVIDDIGAAPNSPDTTSEGALLPASLADPLLPPRAPEEPQTGKPAQGPPGQQPQPISGRDLAAGFGGMDSGGPLSSGNPFAELLGSDRSEPRRTAQGGRRTTGPASDPFADLAPPSGLPSGSQALAAADGPARSPLLPDDFDPFAAAPKSQPAALLASKSDPFADLLSAPESQSIDSMFGLHPSAGGNDALARFSDDRMPGVGAGIGVAVSDDPFALLDGRSTPPRAEPPPFSNHTSDLRASFMPPRSISTAPVVDFALEGTPPISPAAIPSDVTWLLPRPRGDPVTDPSAGAVPRASAPATRPRPESPRVDVPPAPSPAMNVSTFEPEARTTRAVSEEALWQAFCEGAGVTMTLPRGLDAATMRSLGQLIHAAVAGTLQLIAVRASTKQELRADVTMIQARANNPLKFSPDVQTGLEQLLNPPMRGFLAGPEAMTDAMNDLVGHSIGTMAGMRAALDGVMARFSPPELESKLTSKALLDSLLPMSRKARLWDLYLKHFDTIREEAQDDFHTLFGKAFLAAYGQQIDRLKASRSSE